jgi:hypothetical protein
MKTDGLFTVHSFKIPVSTINPVRLVFFGDVHRDSPNHADGAWQEFLEYSRNLPNAYFLGLGDYVDSASTSERACFAGVEHLLHDTAKNDLIGLAEKKVELLAQELNFMRGRIIGLISGNHWWQFADGTNTDMRLCKALGSNENPCYYLGVSSFIRLQFVYGSSSCVTLDVWAHHGVAGGRLLGTSINRVDQMREFADADIYIMGHDHNRLAIPARPRLFLMHSARGGLRLRERKQWLIRSGSFLKSYTPNTRNYVVDSCRGPCSLGHVELEIRANRHAVPEKKFKGGHGPLELTLRGIS